MKRCTKCGTLKPLGEFDIKADRERPASRCKPCRRADQNERNRKLHPPRIRPARIVGTAELLPCTRCHELKPAEAFPPEQRGGEKLQHWCRACFAELNAKRYAQDPEREKSRIHRNRARRRGERRRFFASYLGSRPCVDCGESDTLLLEFDHVRDKRGDVSTLAWRLAPWDRVLEEIAKCEIRCGNCHRRRTAERRRASRKSHASQDPANRARRSDVHQRQAQLQLAYASRACSQCKETKPLSEFSRKSRDGKRVQSRCRSCSAAYQRAWYERNRRTVIQRAQRNRYATARDSRQLVRAYLAEHPCLDCGENDVDVLDFDHLREKTTEVSVMVRKGWSWRTICDEIAKCEVVCTNCHKRRTRQRRQKKRADDAQIALGTASPAGIEPAPAAS